VNLNERFAISFFLNAVFLAAAYAYCAPTLVVIVASTHLGFLLGVMMEANHDR
jgi:hypothetical protein